jgi:AcrR family transcriptional regulator
MHFVRGLDVKFRRMKDSRRGQIMAAARRVFAEKGIAVGIADIARAADISVGGFYLYFQNKEDLLRQLLDETGREVRAALATAFAAPGEPLARFERAGHAFFREICGRRRDALILLLRESVGFSAEVEELRKRLFQQLTDDVADAIRRVSGRNGRRGKRQAQVAALSIFGMLERVAYHYFIWETGSKDRRKVEEEALAFVRDGLGSVLLAGG